MKRSNGEGTITQRKDGLYIYRVTLGDDKDGKAIRRSFSSKKKRIAIQKGLEALSRANIGIVTNKAQEFEPLARLWLKTCETSITPTTMDNYTVILEKRILPYFKKKKIAELKQVDIQKFFNNEVNISQSMLSKIHFILRAIFELAINNEMIFRNPVTGIKMPSVKQRQVKQAYTTEEMHTLLDYAETHPKGKAICTLLLTGMRPEELCGLTWDCVDFHSNTLQIKRAIGLAKGGAYEKQTKNKSSVRSVPIPQRLVGILKEIQKEEGYVFPNEKGNFNNSNNYRKSEYKTFMNDAPVRKLNPHELRHTYNTELIRCGVPEYVIKRLMGHTDKSMTTGVYLQIDIEMLRKYIDKIF